MGIHVGHWTRRRNNDEVDEGGPTRMEKQEGKKSSRPNEREIVIFEDRYNPNYRNDH